MGQTVNDAAFDEACKAMAAFSDDLVRTGSAEAFQNCLSVLPGLMPGPDAFNGAFWSLMNRVFSGKVKLDPQTAAHFKFDHLAPAWLTFTNTLKVPQPPKGFQAGPAHRIAIIAHQILMPAHAPTAYTLDLAQTMTGELGIEVLVVNSNSFPLTGCSPFRGQMIANVNRSLRGRQKLAYNGTELDIYSAQEETIAEGKLTAAIEAVLDFNPGMILAYSGFNILADLLSRYIPTILCPSTREEPVGRAHIILGPNPDNTDLFVHRQSILDFKPSYRQTEFARPVPERTKTVTRAELGIPRTDTVFVVVGNRLKSELDRTFEAGMAEILESAPHASFLIVGLPYRKWKDKRLKSASKRIRFIKYETDLRALYQCCDVFFNPVRQGGGLSAILALAEGCAVLACSGDVASIIGEEKRQPDFKTQIARACQLATDSESLAAARTQARQVFERRPGFSDFVRHLTGLEREARQIFQSVAIIAA